MAKRILLGKDMQAVHYCIGNQYEAHEETEKALGSNLKSALFGWKVNLSNQINDVGKVWLMGEEPGTYPSDLLQLSSIRVR